MSFSIFKFVFVALLALLVSCGRKTADHSPKTSSKTKRVAPETKAELVVEPLPGMDHTVDLQLGNNSRELIGNDLTEKSLDVVKAIPSNFIETGPVIATEQTPMIRDSYRTKAMEKMAKQKQASEGNR